MTDSVFRAALDAEEDHISLILYNAFLPVWNHNWFQNIYEPLPPIPISNPPPTYASIQQTLTTNQKARVGFYRSVFKSVRLLGGEVYIAISPTDEHEIQAVAMWLPPHRRLKLTSVGILLKSGLAAAVARYGIRGAWNLNFIYESNIAALYKKVGVKEEECTFVQMLASNPEYRDRRKGYASLLLNWRMEQLWAEKKTEAVDVCLDTSTEKALAAYLKLGFMYLGEVAVDTGSDEWGIMLGKNATEEQKARAKEVCRDRILVAKNPKLAKEPASTT